MIDHQLVVDQLVKSMIALESVTSLLHCETLLATYHSRSHPLIQYHFGVALLEESEQDLSEAVVLVGLSRWRLSTHAATRFEAVRLCQKIVSQTSQCSCLFLISGSTDVDK